MRTNALLTIGALFLGFVPMAHAFELPPNDGFVTDTVGLLSDDEEEVLETQLTQYADELRTQIAILIVSQVTDDSIDDAAQETLELWGIGQTINTNGILILYAYDDGDIVMAMTNGLADIFPPAIVNGILEEDIMPSIRSASFAEAFTSGADAIAKHITGEYTIDRFTVSEDALSLSAYVTLFLVLVFEWLIAIVWRRKTWVASLIAGAIGSVALVTLYGWWIIVPFVLLIGGGVGFLVHNAYATHSRPPWWAGGSWAPGGK